MPFVSHLVDDGHGIVYLGTGIISSAELLEAAQEPNRSAEKVRRLTHSLVDFTDALELSITCDDVREVVSENEVTASLVPPGVIAVIAPKDHIFGIARMWQAFVEKLDWKVAVFRDKEEAVAWLRHEVPAALMAPMP